jgi:hypothetical protein
MTPKAVSEATLAASQDHPTLGRVRWSTAIPRAVKDNRATGTKAIKALEDLRERLAFKEAPLTGSSQPGAVIDNQLSA